LAVKNIHHLSAEQSIDFHPYSIHRIVLNMRSLVIIAVATIAFVLNVSAFVPNSSGKRRGVKGSSLQMTILTYNGKKKDFKAGSPLSSAAAALGVKPKYSCKKSVKFLRELDPIKCVFYPWITGSHCQLYIVF
jgi:hypothetical protein